MEYSGRALPGWTERLKGQTKIKRSEKNGGAKGIRRRALPG